MASGGWGHSCGVCSGQSRYSTGHTGGLQVHRGFLGRSEQLCGRDVARLKFTGLGPGGMLGPIVSTNHQSVLKIDLLLSSS